jgi:hypothetical protein
MIIKPLPIGKAAGFGAPESEVSKIKQELESDFAEARKRRRAQLTGALLAGTPDQDASFAAYDVLPVKAE